MESCKDNDATAGEVAVVVVPLPAQGHLNQLLQVSCLLSSSSSALQVHYLGFSIHTQQARVRANGLDPEKISKIHFHELPTPELDCPPPDPAAALKFPTHLQPLWEASHLLLRRPAADVLREIASKSRRVVIIHDSIMASVVQDAASIPNAETYSFNCISAFSLLSLIYYRAGRPFPAVAAVEEAGLRELMPDLEDCTSYDIRRLGSAQREFLKFRCGEIHNTSRVIEGPFPDVYEREEFSQNLKQWFIGPILPPLNTYKKKQNVWLDWLDEQPPDSVLYVSFGTMTSVSDQQVTELAKGLEQSKVRFLWVLRDADKGNIFSGKPRRIELPEGFEQRMIKRGVVVREWAPQPEILAHPSTGGFMSHCGWNSCIESITHGVPMAAWPMHSDQPSNGFLVTRILRTGLMVREWGEHRELVKASNIENVVRRLMASEEVRTRAQALGEDVRKSVQPGGVSHIQLHSFIAHITRT
ncbi:unnamed protein product [Cuscuta europaea]|uniref:Glycosyltransferase n=1 Tax=Cuscuta europaea TaxID=41803 RepID=A0A9P0ZJS6_CUSEU|nr:unnamed protein product [Cuscuta europaea]